MEDDQVRSNLRGMDDLDFTGWNNADWNGANRWDSRARSLSRKPCQ